MTGAPAERSRLPIAALGFAACAALSSWNPLAAPFGLAVGLVSVALAVRALRAGGARKTSAAALAVALVAVAASALVLALTAGVGRELRGEAIVPVPGRGGMGAELDAAAERTRAARERARGELDALEPAPGAPSDEKGDRKGARPGGR